MIVRMRGRFSVKQGGTAGIFPVPATVGLLRDRIFCFFQEERYVYIGKELAPRRLKKFLVRAPGTMRRSCGKFRREKRQKEPHFGMKKENKEIRMVY